MRKEKGKDLKRQVRPLLHFNGRTYRQGHGEHQREKKKGKKVTTKKTTH